MDQSGLAWHLVGLQWISMVLRWINMESQGRLDFNGPERITTESDWFRLDYSCHNIFTWDQSDLPWIRVESDWSVMD